MVLLIGLDFGRFQGQKDVGILQDNGFGYLLGEVRPWFFWLDIGFGSWT